MQAASVSTDASCPSPSMSPLSESESNPWKTANAQSEDKQLWETMTFFEFSHDKENPYDGLVHFELVYDDGSMTNRYVRVHPERGASVSLQEPKNEKITCKFFA